MAKNLIITVLVLGCLMPPAEAAIKSGIVPCSIALGRQSVSFVINDFADKAWIDKKFTFAFLKELALLATDDDLIGLNAQQLVALSSLEFKNPRGSKVDFETQLYTRRVNGESQVVPVISMRCGQDLCGVLVLSITRNSSGVLVATSEYFKSDPKKIAIQGIGPHIMPMLKNYYEKLGVKEERLEAGWSGRERWAKEGFRLAEDVDFYEDGKKVSQLELIRSNFLRFLSFHKITLGDLLYEDQSGKRRPLDQSLSQLNQPIDFTKVFHKNGREIKTRSYTDVDTLSGPKSMAIGLAFTHWDYRPRENQVVVILQEGKPLSDIAMPTWIGVRSF